MATSNPFAGAGATLKRPAVQRLIGIGVVVVVAGAVAGVRLLSNGDGDGVRVPAWTAPVSVAHAGVPAAVPASHPAHAPAASNVPAASKARVVSNGRVAAKVPAASNAPAAHTPVSPNAAAAHVAGVASTTLRPSSAGNSQTHVAASGGANTPVVTSVAQGPGVAASEPAHLDEHVTYQYNAIGRRDPFQSLVDGAFVGVDVGGDAPPDPGGIKVVGIVWGADDQFAMVEDVKGNSFVLRKGDKVQNGFVEALKRDGVVVNLTAEGQSQSVVIPLTRKGDQNAR